MSDLDQALVADLSTLGLDARSFRAVILLPLVEVAWADREVQPEERRHILQIAKGHNLLSGRGALALEHWLKERPSDETLTLGRSVLVRLAHRTDGLGADLPESSLDTVVEMCVQVAEAAGGMFGMFWRVTADERKAIRKIGREIEQHASDVRPDNHGVVGQTLTGAWADLLEEMASWDDNDLDAEAGDGVITGSPPESAES